MRLKWLQLLVGKNKLRRFKKIVYTIALLVLTFFSTASPILAATFTAGMAKRDAPGPFAAGVIAQGNGDSSGLSGIGNDRLEVPFIGGNQISGNFYVTLDTNQGSLVFWITPEWNGNDNKRHQILYSSGGAIPSIYTSGSKLIIAFGGNQYSTDISSWTAGTTYSVVLRWDSKNTLDGTNYVSISINDSHAFGYTASSFNSGLGGYRYQIGYGSSISNNTYNANAIIEGLTIYRRPLFDGTYGVDVGNGDEINQIYNSGAGKDPTLITGSWDVVFALPTNSSTGALTTGTGNAWTHPHASNLLYTSTTNTGGFMMNGTYTSDGWTDEGTPTSVSALATSEKIFAGGYKTVSDAANEGIYYDKTVTAGNDWVVRALAHSDGTSIPKVILYDQTNGAEIGSLTGTTTSDRDTPDVFIFTGEAPAGMTTLRVKLINTAASGTTYWHQAEVLTNLINNPGLQTGSGDPWIPTGWNNSGLDAGEALEDTVNYHSGGVSLKLIPNGDREGVQQVPNGYTQGGFHAFGFWHKIVDGTLEFIDANLRSAFQNSFSDATIAYGTPGGWTHERFVMRQTLVSDNYFLLRADTNEANDWNIDDIYSILLTSVSLTTTPASEANSTENTDEIRVDGRDTYVETAGGSLGTTAGYVSMNYRPRHSAADASKFAEDSTDDAYVFALTDSDNSDYVNLYWDSANTLKMEYAMGGSSASGTWDATGAISANTEYTLTLRYTGGSTMTLAVDGTTRITLASIPAAFAEAPDDVYMGSNFSGAKQGDATFSNLTFDTAAPTISLTAFSPDPTSDNTPTLTGTATDAIGTVSAVQFQVDSTAGSWSSCTADDGTFDEASEAFSCTPSALSDGSHTVYVRATDNVANTTSGGSESSDVFTVDTAGPLSITLDSPGSGAIITTRSPIFRFKGTTDGTTSITKYEVVVDFGTGSAKNLVGDIAPTGTDTDTNEKYINYDLDYIEVQSKLAANELTEGDHTWRVIAYDTLENYTYSERSFSIDLSPPALENLTLVDSLGLVEDRHVLTSTKPHITGEVADANFPTKVEVSFYQQAVAGGVVLSENLYLSQTLALANSNRTRVPFDFYTSKDLPLGKYKLVVTGYDKAGNSSSGTFLVSLVPTSLVGQLLYAPTFGLPTNPDTPTNFQQQQAEQDISETVVSDLTSGAKQAVQRYTSAVGRFVGSLLGKVQDTLYNMGSTRLATFARKVRYALADSFATVFGDTPVKIADVVVDEITDNSVTISWTTNKLTINNKVNLGQDLTYGKEKYGLDYTKRHRVTIEGLEPGTEYYFEVMSQGRNYAYDAYYKFTTKQAN